MAQPMSNADTRVLHPEWFDEHGRAKHIPGPRVNPVDPDKTFVWGPCVRVHTLGTYTILEYLDDRSKQSPRCQDGHGRTRFHPYIGTESTDHSTETIEEAITLAIAFNYDGETSAAHMYFLRGIGAVNNGKV